jgi:hypothetical protein
MPRDFYEEENRKRNAQFREEITKKMQAIESKGGKFQYFGNEADAKGIVSQLGNCNADEMGVLSADLDAIVMQLSLPWGELPFYRPDSVPTLYFEAHMGCLWFRGITWDK